MAVELRLTRGVYARMLEDLGRGHHFALERIGFLSSKLVRTVDDSALVLLWDYEPLADEDYVPDYSFGAAFGPDTLRAKKQRLRDRFGTAEGTFCVHQHEHAGRPFFSAGDNQGLPPIIPCFQRAARDAASGLLLLSSDHAIAQVWLPDIPEPATADRVVIVGTPLSIFRS